MTEAHKKNSEAEEKFAFAKIILGLDICYYYTNGDEQSLLEYWNWIGSSVGLNFHPNPACYVGGKNLLRLNGKV